MANIVILSGVIPTHSQRLIIDCKRKTYIDSFLLKLEFLSAEVA